ncbi:hypothetical protein KM043_013671 [Ampulex compressa]|nr:hypothetical protein KM043_013671 [Ampulex compressa]
MAGGFNVKVRRKPPFLRQPFLRALVSGKVKSSSELEITNRNFDFGRCKITIPAVVSYAVSRPSCFSAPRIYGTRDERGDDRPDGARIVGEDDARRNMRLAYPSFAHSHFPLCRIGS